MCQKCSYGIFNTYSDQRNTETKRWVWMKAFLNERQEKTFLSAIKNFSVKAFFSFDLSVSLYL